MQPVTVAVKSGDDVGRAPAPQQVEVRVADGDDAAKRLPT